MLHCIINLRIFFIKSLLQQLIDQVLDFLAWNICIKLGEVVSVQNLPIFSAESAFEHAAQLIFGHHSTLCWWASGSECGSSPTVREGVLQITLSTRYRRIKAGDRSTFT
jgi:hypothetical protein